MRNDLTMLCGFEVQHFGRFSDNKDALFSGIYGSENKEEKKLAMF